jgi:hypothetical protein
MRLCQSARLVFPSSFLLAVSAIASYCCENQPAPKPGVATTPVEAELPEAVLAPVSLKSIANYGMNHLSPPTGRVTLGGIPFEIPAEGNNTFQTGATATGEIGVQIAKARAVHILMNAAWGAEFRGKKVGTVTLTFADGMAVSFPIVCGESVRETWDFKDQAAERKMAKPLADIQWRNVLEAQQNRGRPAVAYIDMVTLLIPEGLAGRTLAAITVADQSKETPDSRGIILEVYGITVRATVVTPYPPR